jgi:hypothetical protein
MIGYKKPLGKAMMGFKMPLGKNQLGFKMPLLEKAVARKVADVVEQKISSGLERRILKR